MTTFAELLTQYTARTGISDSELARAIGVRRQTVFRWKEGLSERPRQRDDVVRCAVKLRLSREESDALLLAAGFAPATAAPPRPPVGDAVTVRDVTGATDPTPVSAAAVPAPPMPSVAPDQPAIAAEPVAATVPPAPARPFLRRGLWPALIGFLSLLLIGALWTQQMRGAVKPLPTARPGQALILLASRETFALAIEGSQAAAAAQAALQRELQAARLGATTELRELPVVLPNFDSAAAARARSRASLLLWRRDSFSDAEAGFPDDLQAAHYVILTADAPPTASLLDSLLAAPASLSFPIHASRPNEVRSLALLTLGLLSSQQGAWDQAASAFSQAAAQAPSEQEAAATLAFLSGYVSQRSRPADLPAAIAFYSQTLALTPASGAALLNRGLAYVRLDRPAQWQADFNALLAQQPDDARGLTALCWAWALDNQPSLALPYCDRAIQQKTSPVAFDGRALARASQGNWPGTVEDLQAFLSWPTGQAFADRNALETTHRAWLAAARAGQNPFDDTVRARLRKE
jgi:hypothetical protein